MSQFRGECSSSSPASKSNGFSIHEVRSQYDETTTAARLATKRADSRCTPDPAAEKAAAALSGHTAVADSPSRRARAIVAASIANTSCCAREANSGRAARYAINSDAVRQKLGPLSAYPANCTYFAATVSTSSPLAC